ncbi:hypothetical protein [Amycolatopsis thermoflava]|uniref:hypothetical protein n=1 Tax=Amycolatopsis thermoflava TaxID=84480 RepID=UPI00040F8281|nr:hypothetical protein [Amycolatopsis thermoflava]
MTVLNSQTGDDIIGFASRGTALLKGAGEVDPDTARKAALFVAAHADDAEDCAQLLDMLGLIQLPHEPPVVP